MEVMALEPTYFRHRWNERHTRAHGRRHTLRFVILAFLVHILVLISLSEALPWLFPTPDQWSGPISLIVMAPSQVGETLPEVPPEPSGQLVEIARPEVEKIPRHADYLSNYNQRVERETRTEKVKVNPEVLDIRYSKESKAQTEDLMELNVDKPSTGAKVGNERFDPDRDGTLASLPSPWAFTNKDGRQDPVPAAHLTSARRGAPQNDWLDEEVGRELALNTKEYLYNGYIQRIRRLVNFYWQQNLDNLPRSVRLSKTQYSTTVLPVLDANGALDGLDVVEESGSSELDDAVLRAFRVAGPFPNPPEGLIEPDGRAYLPNMGFKVNIGTARAQYQGIDPRAGVQFPGILKSPR
jgi:protein TonB